MVVWFGVFDVDDDGDLREETGLEEKEVDWDE